MKIEERPKILFRSREGFCLASLGYTPNKGPVASFQAFGGRSYAATSEQKPHCP
jgi:hypothetical protein